MVDDPLQLGRAVGTRGCSEVRDRPASPMSRPGAEARADILGIEFRERFHDPAHAFRRCSFITAKHYREGTPAPHPYGRANDGPWGDGRSRAPDEPGSARSLDPGGTEWPLVRPGGGILRRRTAAYAKGATGPRRRGEKPWRIQI